MPSTRFRSLSDPESLKEFAKNLREGIYISTRDGRILDANRAFLEMFGVQSVEDFGEYGASNLFVDPARRTEEIALLERDGSVREFEVVVRLPHGETRTVLDTCYLIRDPDTDEAFIHGILVDITAHKELEATLLELSTHDALTGAFNRRYLANADERFAADADLKCGCLFIDVDHFKLYNDRWGHQEGDEILRRMARFLMRYTRLEEAVLRIGGDEFVVVLHGADADETKAVADRIRSEALEGAPVPFSLGWAAREPGETVQRLLDRADQGMMAVRVIKRLTDPRQQHPLVR
ncbi:MAG TPA: sensor domain-containing diguanylate cyclase [Gemmatimonadaceae bacterium]|nr:sensor domain-containing diguanylate cyclase [Gemmatimonadaceae bacterium]